MMHLRWRTFAQRILLHALPPAVCLSFAVSCAPADAPPQPLEDHSEKLVTTASEIRELARERTGSLKDVDLPEVKHLDRFVKDRAAALRLGKSLFWDQQVGSDGQACASCHFHAGADNRTKNQLNPGGRNEIRGIDPTAFNDRTGFGPNRNDFGPNYQLKAEDYPFRKLSDPDDRSSKVISDTNEVSSSQGVFNAFFVQVGVPFDLGIPSLEGNGAIFNVNGVLVRNVETRQTPTAINAAFNHRNFWDGRARFEFNGVSPIGDLDPGVKLVERQRWGQPALVSVRIRNSSLASQAVGPVTSELETAFGATSATFMGRRFPDVARKLLAATTVPLGQQSVRDDDSVLGELSAEPNNGITVSYRTLVEQAFDERWWNVPGYVVDLSGKTPVLRKRKVPLGPNEYTVMEYNFTLFFGLAVQEYERTLISNDTPFDRFMDGDDHALSSLEQQGLVVFVGKGKCANCHGGPELTNASVGNVRGELIERMVMGDGRVAVYDNGFYNIGVRPTREDIGVGGRIGPRNLPLSFSRRFQNQVDELVKVLRTWWPFLSKDKAIRLANQTLGVPRIPARPDEAARLLEAAGPKAIGELTNARDELAGKIAKASRWRRPMLLERLASVDALLAAAKAALSSGAPADAVRKLDDAADKLASLAQLVDACVDAQVDAARDLLAPSMSLLPDPIDPGPDPEHPYAPPLRPDERVAVDGAFKTPGLRNVAESAPYFHNGGQATLEQVVTFYNRGADFADVNRKDLDPDIQPLGLTRDERAALVAFLHALTDERVRNERAPFDHPSLDVPHGGTVPTVRPFFAGAPVLDDRFVVPAVGKDGSPVPLGTPNTPFGNFLQPLD